MLANSVLQIPPVVAYWIGAEQTEAEVVFVMPLVVV